MIASILTEGKDPATTPVITFDNGTATVNTEICEKLGLDFDTVSEAFAPYCTRVGGDHDRRELQRSRVLI